MAGRVIEAKAVLSGEDRLSGILDRVNRKLRDVGKGAKVSADIERMNKSLAGTKRQLEALDRVKAAQSRLSTARLGLTGARAEADRIGSALATAKQVKDVKAVAELTARNRVAQRAVAQATGAVERQTSAVADARRAFAGFGVPVENLIAHERALRSSVDQTTAAIRKQALAQRDRERFAEAKALKLQRRQEALEAAMPTRPRPIPTPTRRTERGERSLGPLAGAIGAYEAADQYRKAAAFDRRLTMIGQTADATREQIDGLGSSVHELAQQTATPVDKLAGGLEALVAQGRNLKESLDFLPSVARTAAASGSEVDDIAKTADSVGTNFEIAGKQMQKAFDIMAAGGKAGQFELKDMARYLPSLGPAASAIGFKGEKGLSDLVAMLQTMRKGSGTAEEAVASMNNILAKMESDKTIKGFKALGIDAEAAFKKARKEGKNLVEVFEELVQKGLKGDRSRLGELIDDMEFKRGVQALMSYRGEWQKLSASLRDNSGGTVMRDLVQVTKDAQAGLDRLSNSTARFTQALARLADAGGVSSGLGGAGKEFESIAVALERINKAYAEGGLTGAISQAAGDASERMKENRKAWLDERGKQETGRVAELEADNKRFREKLEREGQSPASIEKTMQLRQRDVDRARRRQGAVEKAKADPALADKKPLMMGVNPLAPIQGTPGEVGPGVTSFQQAYPINLTRRAKPRVVPLPPQRPASMPREIESIHDVLGPNAGRPGSGPAGPVTAKVESPVPVAVSVSDLTGQATLTGNFTIAPSPLFTATFDGIKQQIMQLSGKVSAIGGNGPGSTGHSSPDAGKGGRD
ncbi:phage tail tape measure protein [Methylobacterium haplocladii]|uniref:phage tail tape measure protein n=2 Tax=Methylobacterium haplocladii TaxID=1176176 RepID=UPI00235CFDB1|nr:phage tail tape measure protein [Methylobacterium haplocladii]GLS59857.1 hypothetical protein GCM10007887_25300 [Methylobacterium haplocladii]